jgi:hypothetical protein
MPATYTPISSFAVTSAGPTITVSSIPQTFTDLIVVCVGTTTSGGSIRVRFNNDSSNIYNTTYLYSDGSALTAGSTGTLTSGVYMGRIASSGTFGGAIFSVMNYTNTSNNKTAIGQNFGSEPLVWLSSGTWNSTAAINRLDFTDESSGNFNIGFTVNLYGVLAA